MPQVFISHDTESDGPFAQRLANDLRDLEVNVWIAPACIRPGEQWIDAIGSGLEASTHFALVSTPRAYASSWVRKEYNAALLLQADGEIEVVPLEVEKTTIPLFLREFQLISFRKAYDTGLRQLASLLNPTAGVKAGREHEAHGIEQSVSPSAPTGGAIAQGSGAAAVGAGGVFVGGSDTGTIKTGGGALIGSTTRDNTELGQPPFGHYGNKRVKIFLAYDIRDQEYAKRLADFLDMQGVNRWMAPNSIEPGTRWDVAIADAIVDSTAIVVIMTPHSSQSRWVQQELLVAEREAIPIFPILLAGDPFESLRKRQFVDARSGELPPDRFIQRLKRDAEKA